MIQKFFAAILSVLFYPAFFISLIVFHGIQVFCRRILGKKAHKKSVEILNFFLLRCINLVGNTTTYVNNQHIPEEKPLLIVSNHQSMFDISMIAWYMRKYDPLYISKIELGKGIPSISYNLRHGGSVLIDRKNRRQSLPVIMDFGKRLQNQKLTGVIFPEGTRSRDGKPKEFNESGLKLLTRNMPDGYIIPITINNSWKLMRYGYFPVGGFSNIKLEVHEPIAIASCDFDELKEKVERQITLAIK